MPVEISYHVCGGIYTCYLANSAGTKPAPGPLLIHEATSQVRSRESDATQNWRTS